jgi:hypothetical protein
MNRPMAATVGSTGQNDGSANSKCATCITWAVQTVLDFAIHPPNKATYALNWALALKPDNPLARNNMECLVREPRNGWGTGKQRPRTAQV